MAHQDTIEAEFIEADTAESPRATALEVTHIRRAPSSAPAQARGTISMQLDDWLQVDRRMHELYNLCELALLQRDSARGERDAREEARAKSEDYAEKLASRLIEWKRYARKLEERAYQAQIELLTVQHEADRARELASEALALGILDRKRRKELKARLDEE